MKKHIALLAVSLCLALTACEDDFLDRKIDTNYTEGQVFSSYTTIRNFGIGIYNYLPQGFDRIDGAMLASATDDAVHTGVGRDIQRLTNGSWGPFNNPDEQWGHYYAGIRKANLFLEKTVGYKNTILRDTITADGKQAYQVQSTELGLLRSEARFLRAYFYFELAKRYGGVPVITQVLSPDEDPGLSRSSFEETADFIVSELAAVDAELRESWVGVFDDGMIGRATKGAALALRARVLLYAASPLHNPSGDRQKWVAAAAAAHQVIALSQYNLVNNYRNLFREMHNNEIIFARRYAPSNGFERSNFPVGFEGAVGGTNPSQDLVNAYETKNGLSIEEDPAYNPQKPYTGRDPRLGMTVIVNDSDYKGRRVEIYPGGSDGPGRPRATRTGYYLKKYVDEGLDLQQNRTSNHTWIFFRYAEVLLNYAEAMNEAFGPDQIPADFTLSAREALNMVRSRNGVYMPAVEVMGQDAFREKVRNERRVELAFEEHRFWDLRRWMIADEVLSTPINGVRVSPNADGSFDYNFLAQPVEQRTFQDYMYLYPIPRIEIDKSEGRIAQNPGW
ncbi:RagB/SusD family nutrient uptake outer membrane protein [Pontibacter sp. E15-1]|uniref:RagB/SusD family nutrient uptake outer membrane protein n=1 Tax=Pontibacter sp. E15-1 TaxID=2919918 RepID=UPI001F500517|nr:RagB/SusD family nutrient uptake outer membrane protein [Pontibacter sp. E15-1]MCJ8164303.1 RagB/SusD family nutrient uptake outer membrane protein [Pontibacter sp. E15-1]